jgi:CBS domain-containing protein
MLVRDVMQTDLVTVPATETVREAIGRMLEAEVGSVIVTHEGTPAGIVTETDVLEVGYADPGPFDEIEAGSVMSSPLVTVEPGATVRRAIGRMRDRDVKKLPVVDGVDLVGIVTMSDVVSHHSEAVREALRLDEGKRGWSQSGTDR